MRRIKEFHIWRVKFKSTTVSYFPFLIIQCSSFAQLQLNSSRHGIYHRRSYYYYRTEYFASKQNCEFIFTRKEEGKKKQKGERSATFSISLTRHFALIYLFLLFFFSFICNWLEQLSRITLHTISNSLYLLVLYKFKITLWRFYLLLYHSKLFVTFRACWQLIGTDREVSFASFCDLELERIKVISIWKKKKKEKYLRNISTRPGDILKKITRGESIVKNFHVPRFRGKIERDAFNSFLFPAVC